MDEEVARVKKEFEEKQRLKKEKEEEKKKDKGKKDDKDKDKKKDDGDEKKPEDKASRPLLADASEILACTLRVYRGQNEAPLLTLPDPLSTLLLTPTRPKQRLQNRNRKKSLVCLSSGSMSPSSLPTRRYRRALTLDCRTFFQQRLDRKRQAEAAKRNRERLQQSNFFPSVPTGFSGPRQG